MQRQSQKRFTFAASVNIIGDYDAGGENMIIRITTTKIFGLDFQQQINTPSIHV